jgi:hypothetical protein
MGFLSLRGTADLNWWRYRWAVSSRPDLPTRRSVALWWLERDHNKLLLQAQLNGISRI